MTRAKSIKLIAAALLLWTTAISGEQSKPEGLQIHLPRTATVSGKVIRLGSLGIVRGPDAKLVARVSDVTMGRTPWSKEKIVINRNTILSRLAGSGFKPGTVRLTGAAKITVTRNEKIFAPKDLVQLAETFLNKTRPAPEDCKWRLLRNPSELVVPEAANIELKPRMGKEMSSGYLYVEVAAVSGKQELGVAKILFKQFYSMRQLIALRNISSGSVITRKNAVVKTISVSRKPPAWKSPYGMICAQSVRAGRVIRPSLWRSEKPVVMVRRNRAVRMKIQMKGFMIITTGQALQDGRIGELIKVRNVDSKRIIMATVGADGTVTPVFNKR